MLRPFKKPHGRLPRGPSVPSPPRNQHARTSPAFQVSSAHPEPRRRTPKEFFNSLSKRDSNHLLLPGSFLLLRRFGVQFYTERSYHLENGVKVGTAFA